MPTPPTPPTPPDGADETRDAGEEPDASGAPDARGEPPDPSVPEETTASGDGGDDPGDDRADDAPDDNHDDAQPPDGASASPPARGMLVERAAEMGVEPAPPPRRTGVFVDHESLREHVGGLLRSMLGGYEVDALGNMTFTAQGARVFVTVGPGPMGPHVGVFSILTVDVPLTGDLAGFLLTSNHRMAFGSFSYEQEQRAVWLRHSLLGATLDGPELRSAVISVASTAAKVTEMLQQRFGGGTFADADEEVKRAAHPPEPTTDGDAVGVSGYL